MNILTNFTSDYEVYGEKSRIFIRQRISFLLFCCIIYMLDSRVKIFDLLFNVSLLFRWFIYAGV